MKPVSIVVAVVAAMLVTVIVVSIGWMFGSGASWWLEHVDGVTGLTGKDLAAAVDAVRGRVLAAATGLAALAAVYYTARNADTARRTFQLGERGHDTDRYSKAVEQLGSDQAPVRLGGLYALEQLAENNVALRRRVVDVICAYLRMPYDPREEASSEKIRAAQRAARGRKKERNSSLIPDPREERQVRLAAQRILADHLHLPGLNPFPLSPRTATSPAFWPNICLELTGATLLQADFSYCAIASAEFSWAVFDGDARFDGALFGHAEFEDATFRGEANFRAAKFVNRPAFARATFSGEANFHTARFGQPGFVGTTVMKTGLFKRSKAEIEIFATEADFTGATFADSAVFDQNSRERLSLEGAVVTESDALTWCQPDWHPELDGQGRRVLRRNASIVIWGCEANELVSGMKVCKPRKASGLPRGRSGAHCWAAGSSRKTGGSAKIPAT